MSTLGVSPEHARRQRVGAPTGFYPSVPADIGGLAQSVAVKIPRVRGRIREVGGARSGWRKKRSLVYKNTRVDSGRGWGGGGGGV